jgi:type IV secretory pathway TrbF-like protein
MEFNQLDIEAVAKSRVSRQEGKRLNQVIWGVFIGVIIGMAVAWRINMFAGYGIVIIAIGIFLWQSSKVTKKQTLAMYQMVKMWKSEQEENKVEVK